MQEKRNSIASALELRLSPTNTTIDADKALMNISDFAVSHFSADDLAPIDVRILTVPGHMHTQWWPTPVPVHINDMGT